jgi:hypothetical protein
MDEQTQPAQPLSFGWEKNLNPMIFGKDAEKSFIDKVLDRKDSERLRDLMMKPELTRTELLELLYIIVSINTKLVNFSDWDRYLLGKFLAWIRDFCTLHESLLDYMESINQMDADYAKELVTATGDRKKIVTEELRLMQDIKRSLEQVRRYDSHNLKFLTDIYLYLSNSTLSIGATAFDTLSKNRYEYTYPGQGYAPASPPTKRGVFDFLKKGD